MSEAEFRAKRRQKYLTEQYFALNTVFLVGSQRAYQQGVDMRRDTTDRDPFGQGGIFQDKLRSLKLSFTAGCPIEELRVHFAEVVQALGEWTAAYREYITSLAKDSGNDLREDGSPLFFEELSYYQYGVEVASLSVLLGDGESTRRIAVLLERYRGTDLLFEALIAPAVPDPRDNTDFFHTQPYDPLIDAFYTADTPEESVGFMHKYLAAWYKSFEGVPWHNGHLKANDEYMNYYGYWSFEAAAISVIYNIDDSSFRDHIVYPKDLADWARANKSLEKIKAGVANPSNDSSLRLRCEGGKPCPCEGYWMTPAREGSRQHFKVNETMPIVGGDYGVTIWQWDEQQQ
jgi:hypothetical protein